jgi:hypothetical protein
MKKSQGGVVLDAAWANGLPALDLDALCPLFDELAGETKNAAIELDADRAHRRQPTRRTMVDQRRTANAVAHVDRLPHAGETIHMLAAGGYSLFHLIAATLQLAAPATIAYLGIATLGFSRENLEQLLAMLDAHQVEQLDFLYSIYFRSVERKACDRLTYELVCRKQRVASVRTHAKVLLIELSDGRAFVVESSANLRSCRNIEQSTFTHDRALLDFHRGWMKEIFDQASR